MSERECVRGHLIAGPNVKTRPSKPGAKTCLACSRAVAYVYHHPDADVREVADWHYARITRPKLSERVREPYRWDWVAEAEPPDADLVERVRDKLKDWTPEATR